MEKSTIGAAMSSFIYATSAGTAGTAGFYAPHSRSSASYDQPPSVTTVASVTVSFYILTKKFGYFQ